MNSPPCWKHRSTCVPQGQCCLLQVTIACHRDFIWSFRFLTLFCWYITHNIININNITMFRVIQLFVFVFGRIVHRTIRIRPNSLKPLFGTSLVNTVAESYISISASPGGAAEHATARKSAKYSSLPSSHIFQPLALETLGPINTTGITFLAELGHRLTSVYLLCFANSHLCWLLDYTLHKTHFHL